MIDINYIADKISYLNPVNLTDMQSISLMDRTETKYVVGINKIAPLIQKINGNYKVLEIGGQRALDYHNVYLDTPDLLLFDQHVTGKSERYKIRFRNYKSTGVTFLEIKRKNNKGRTKKWRIENKPADSEILSKDAVIFIKQHIGEKLTGLKPVLINNFRRITLGSLETMERITIDFDLRYSDRGGSAASFPYIAVIEVKKSGAKSFSPFDIVLKDNRMYPCGFSKYCMGTAAIKEIRHRNNLKEKFLLINKIENEYSRNIYIG